MDSGTGLADLLPMPPWQGPPLPRFLGILWPWLQGGEDELFLPMPKDYVSSDIVTSNLAPGTYNNEETWDIEWDKETGLPTKITVHRHANRS